VPKIRFSLRSLMLLTLVVCVALWTWPAVKFWYQSTPIEQRVTEFNQPTIDAFGFLRTYDLTEQEVIETKVEAFKTTAEENRLLKQISSTKRIPKGSQFVPGPLLQSGSSFDTLALEVMADDESVHVPIREAPPINFSLPPIHDPLENYYTDLIVL